MYLSCIVTFDASPICVRTMHDSVFRVNRGQQKSRLNEYMFMNKISMSKTCLYKFSCKKAIYQIFTTTSRYRGHLATVQHNTNFATVHSRVTVGGCSVDYEYKLLHQFTTTVGGASCYYDLNRARATHCRAT